MLHVRRIYEGVWKFPKCRKYLLTSYGLHKNINMITGNNLNYITWFDSELTGLDVDKDKILEVACLITNEHLDVISEEVNIVIHQPDDVLNNMNEWCLKYHKQSGLIEESKKSTTSVEEAEERLLKLVQKYVPEKACPLAGNSISEDRRFLLKYMPRFTNYLHYRIIDVSSIKELVKRWDVDTYNATPMKMQKHRAIDDVKESISELAYYKRKYF